MSPHPVPVLATPNSFVLSDTYTPDSHKWQGRGITLLSPSNISPVRLRSQFPQNIRAGQTNCYQPPPLRVQSVTVTKRGRIDEGGETKNWGAFSVRVCDVGGHRASLGNEAHSAKFQRRGPAWGEGGLMSGCKLGRVPLFPFWIPNPEALF